MQQPPLPLQTAQSEFSHSSTDLLLPASTRCCKAGRRKGLAGKTDSSSRLLPSQDEA